MKKETKELLLGTLMASSGTILLLIWATFKFLI